MDMVISSDTRFYHCLRYLANKFHKRLRQVADRYQLTLPRTVNHDQLSDALVYQIVTTIKGQYLQDKIKIKHATLNRILINYDQKTDIVIASSLLHLTDTLLLDALYDFGLTQLKKRWAEVAQLVNTNQTQLAQPTLFNELLRFLILNLDCKTAEAHVIWRNQHAKVCNSHFDPFPQSDESIINTLIDLAPRQVFIHVDPHLTAELITEIETLFPNCICIEYGHVL